MLSPSQLPACKLINSSAAYSCMPCTVAYMCWTQECGGANAAAHDTDLLVVLCALSVMICSHLDAIGKSRDLFVCSTALWRLISQVSRCMQL